MMMYVQDFDEAFPTTGAQPRLPQMPQAAATIAITRAEAWPLMTHTYVKNCVFDQTSLDKVYDSDRAG